MSPPVVTSKITSDDPVVGPAMAGRVAADDRTRWKLRQKVLAGVALLAWSSITFFVG